MFKLPLGFEWTLFWWSKQETQEPHLAFYTCKTWSACEPCNSFAFYSWVPRGRDCLISSWKEHLLENWGWRQKNDGLSFEKSSSALRLTWRPDMTDKVATCKVNWRLETKVRVWIDVKHCRNWERIGYEDKPILPTKKCENSIGLEICQAELFHELLRVCFTNDVGFFGRFYRKLESNTGQFRHITNSTFRNIRIQLTQHAFVMYINEQNVWN